MWFSTLSRSPYNENEQTNEAKAARCTPRTSQPAARQMPTTCWRKPWKQKARARLILFRLFTQSELRVLPQVTLRRSKPSMKRLQRWRPWWQARSVGSPMCCLKTHNSFLGIDQNIISLLYYHFLGVTECVFPLATQHTEWPPKWSSSWRRRPSGRLCGAGGGDAGGNGEGAGGAARCAR